MRKLCIAAGIALLVAAAVAAYWIQGRRRDEAVECGLNNVAAGVRLACDQTPWWPVIALGVFGVLLLVVARRQDTTSADPAVASVTK